MAIILFYIGFYSIALTGAVACMSLLLLLLLLVQVCCLSAFVVAAAACTSLSVLFSYGNPVPERMHDWNQRCLSLTTIGLTAYQVPSSTYLYVITVGGNDGTMHIY